MMSNFLEYTPVVYCVRDKYEIIFITKEAGIGAVIIDGKKYVDSICGVVRSTSCIHKIYVKTDILDKAGSYTIEFRRIPERLQYHTVLGTVDHITIPFRGLPTDRDVNCYIISDTHGYIDEPSRVAGYFGDKLDLLIMGGDMGHNVNDNEGLLTTYILASNITKGERPTIFVKGNHDNRGALAEFLYEYVGTENGLTYFPVRLGKLYFVVLDYGECEADDHESFGGLADFATIRDAQSEMLDQIIENSKNEYDAEGVDVRIALCHIPFTRGELPYPDKHVKWAKCFNQMKVDVLLAGHTHSARFTPVEKLCPANDAKFPCVECAYINREDPTTYKGTAMIIGKEKITVRFTDINYDVSNEYIIDLNQK